MEATSSVVEVEVSDEASFDSYVRDRQAGLLRLAWHVTRDWERARDAVQDALVGLFPRWARLSDQAQRDAYVHRTVVNACLAGFRRDRRLLPVAEVAAEVDAPDPMAGVIDAALLLSWCGTLPVQQRAALALRFYRDLSFAEVGAALGCPEATARSHVHRALAALRRLADQEGEHHA